MAERRVRAEKSERPARRQAPAPQPLPALGARSGPAGGGEAEWGGKALALSRLRQHGLPVPAGFVVPVDLYRSARRDPGVLRALQTLGAALDRNRPPAPETLSRDYPDLAPAAAALRPAAAASLAAWRGGAPRWLVVRSSATGEDGAQHSFAGVLESYLAVAPQHVPEAILLCWAAAETRRFRAYCARREIDPEGVAVGVLVQAMVAARAAGVLYTHDPVSGAPDPVLNAILGLGSALVQGDLAPDEYRRTGSGRWEAQAGRQSWQELLTDAELMRVELAPAARGRLVLTPREREALARLGQRVARIMGGPQDIEWALDERRLWLLQARPITTRARPGRVWTRANLKEIYPELPAPMTASLIERYEANWLVDLFESRGFRVRHLGPAVRLIRGRPYSNQTLLEAVSAAGGVDATPLRQGLGDGGDGAAGDGAPGAGMRPEGRALLRNALPLSRLLWDFLLVRRRVPRLLAAAARQAEQMLQAPLTPLDDAALLAGAVGAYQALQPLDAAMTDVMGALEVCSWLATALLKGGVAAPEPFLAATTGPTAENVTARQARDLDALIALGRADGPVQAWLAAHDHPALPDLQELRDTGFGAALAQFLESYGDRGIHESDSAVPRFGEDPGPLLRAIRTAVLAPSAPDRGEREERRQQEEAAAWAAFQRGQIRWERVLPHRAGAVRLLVGHLRQLSAVREAVRQSKVRLIGARRRWELALGARWAARGWLSAPEDYFWLRLEDAERAVANSSALPPGWLRERVARHRAEHEAWAAQPMPNEWSEGAAPASGSPRRAGDAGRAAERGRLRGLPVSPGVVEGEVTVVSGPEALDAVRPGRILVLPVLGPSWLPLFPGARGLVVEMGGVLSHGAILAREYGLPTVANLPGITQRLRSGERIRLDGTRGLIWRLGDRTGARRGARSGAEGRK